ncbi:uncharacterized protein LOC133737363 [Rosa rugosa]|uniref:uncharacterized protein LOC133737363 n=1 Tax=Rosa rugosa TaxID=74645 RepID=UPI002B40B00D|nr:uncharacterized protein LOC133737363 [Rosa rugosa]
MDTIDVKPENFDGQNFRRWQKQMRYWLTILGLVSTLEDTTSETPSKKTTLTISTPTSETQSSKSTTPKMTKDEIEYHCHNRILSTLSNDLYDVYRDTTSAKSLWEELEAEYGLDDAGIDRFTVSTFNSYKMVEEKTVSVQIHEFKDLLRKVESKGTKFTEEFKVSCLIDKLPPSWSNFAKSLRHKHGELTLTKVFNNLRVDEKHRLEEQIEEGKSKVNLVENSNNRNRFQRRKNSFKRTNRNNSFH